MFIFLPNFYFFGLTSNLYFLLVADVRHIPFVENVVAIYRSLDATFCASLFQSRSSGEASLFLESFSD